MHNEKVNVDFWIRLLSISTRLSFERARTRAIEEIDRYGDLIDPVEKITLARNCDVPEWLTPAYERICMRIKPLDLDEAKVVGMETAVLLGQAREAIRKRSIKDSPKHPPLKSRPNPLYDNIDPSLVTRTVKETFWRYTQGL
ncbi:hypothetical protein PHLCEN_2v3440 [Hermanssonia centrifuga]|uniref:Uncharacterized protein n=1 Tax=Hermanssonia centrifuga TaxID=98765 RepID=A0A2R6QIP1_9APHY|nr:hypothetical protein PHLCEN_2v3440 [Hermanssonia centrifuga]